MSEGSHEVPTPKDFPFKVCFDNAIGGRYYSFYSKKEIESGVEAFPADPYDVQNAIGEWLEQQNSKKRI